MVVARIRHAVAAAARPHRRGLGRARVGVELHVRARPGAVAHPQVFMAANAAALHTRNGAGVREVRVRRHGEGGGEHHRHQQRRYQYARQAEPVAPLRDHPGHCAGGEDATEASRGLSGGRVTGPSCWPLRQGAAHSSNNDRRQQEGDSASSSASSRDNTTTTPTATSGYRRGWGSRSWSYRTDDATGNAEGGPVQRTSQPLYATAAPAGGAYAHAAAAPAEPRSACADAAAAATNLNRDPPEGHLHVPPGHVNRQASPPPLAFPSALPQPAPPPPTAAASTVTVAPPPARGTSWGLAAAAAAPRWPRHGRSPTRPVNPSIPPPPPTDAHKAQAPPPRCGSDHDDARAGAPASNSSSVYP